MMTPKEKSKDLINSFYYSLPNNGSETGLNSTTIRYKEAIQCALITVDEILNFINTDAFSYTNEEYWQEVKDELNKQD
jgi:hypothetical protein